jgi:hypothetical protein
MEQAIGERHVQPLRRHLGFGRMLTWTLAGAGINDFLQAGFTALTRKANELSARA